MGRKSLDKGKSGEREFIRLVSKLTGGVVQLRRNLDQSRAGGDDCLGHKDFSFEIKRRKKVTDGDITEWWRQTVGNAGKKDPVLAWRPDFQHWRIMVRPPYHLFGKNDPRGCFTMDIELFCKLLTDPELRRCCEKAG